MEQIIENLKQSKNYRELHSIITVQKYIISDNKQYINFSSNDYLGLSDTDLQQKFMDTLDLSSNFYLGTPSSRLMTGNIEAYNTLETNIANILEKECALVLGSGFLLNSGALAALTQPNDLIIADKLVHASIIDGIKLCKCDWVRFKHNDIEHLNQILEKNHKQYNNIYIVTESVFSMDGDSAKLQEIVELKKKYGFKIYLDEAHAFGVLGKNGYGLSEKLGLLNEIDYYVATMGKAIASQGAFIACDKISREVLINKMRTLIYSTSLPEISLLWSNFIISQLPKFDQQRSKLIELLTRLSTFVNINVNNFSHIVPIVLGNNLSTTELSNELKELGYWVTAIKSPTVQKGSERIRISLNSRLELEDIDKFGKILKTLVKRYGVQL